MKKLIRSISLILCMVTLLLSFGCDCNPEQKEDGLSFTAFTTYNMEKALEQNPKTMEVVYSIESDFLGRAGVLVGNYNGTNQAINLEIHEGGKPRLFYQDGAGKTHEYKFNYDSRKSDWVHLAVTWDYTTVKFYIDGELKKEASLKISQAPKINNPFVIGGDLRSGNTQFFKGKIKSVALFSDVRTADEIASDYASFDTTADNLLSFHKISNEDLTDYANHGYTLKAKHDLIATVNEPSEYEFSFMAIGDTQIVTYYYPDKLKNIYDYVLDNVQKKKVKHVFGLGDITDDDNQREWDVAYEQISRMDGVVPYSVIRGNHDIYSAGRSMGVSSFFDTYFGKDTSPYAKQYIDCYRGASNAFKARNTVHEFSSSTRDYLVIALDYGPDDDILAWANEVAKNHPNHNIIVTTHAYLTANGKFVTKANGGAYPTRDYPKANDADNMWEEFISKHENIVMVLCGHSPTGSVLLRNSTGEHGNTVAEILVDPQGIDESLEAMGMVATFYVSADGKTVTVDYYSTVHNKYYRPENQYSFQIETIERA